jgi:aspartyl-tRNA(Asn)/glutamyl-tRNA(Gln) amidotransferase subunit A
MAAELWNAGAGELAAMVRRRQVSPVDIVQALLKRIDALDPKVQAWETIDREGALQTARELESVHDDLPLKGVPVGVKDIFLTGGLRTAASFPPFGKFVPEHEAEAVMRLRRAGAIVLGKTVTTQFALADPPRTRNPWNLERTPGGSSSGSAAAVGGRMVPLALGSQTKGSVLRPAAYCGAVGFKPTFGRISRRNVFPLAWSFDTMGFICRSVEDATLTLSVLAGHDPDDPSSAREPVGDCTGRRTNPPKLGLVRDYFDRAEPGVREHVQGVARKLEAAGAQLIELRLPMDFELVSAVHDAIMHVEAAAIHSQLIRKEPAGYAPLLRQTVEAGHLISAVSYVQAQRLRRRFRTRMEELLDHLDALLTPTASNVAPGPETTGDPSFQAPWTQIGLPSISLPTGVNEEGLPTAVQLAGRRLREGELLGAARWAEEILGPMPAPPL